VDLDCFAGVPVTVPVTVPTTVPVTVPATVPVTVPSTVPATVPVTIPTNVPVTIPAPLQPPEPVLFFSPDVTGTTTQQQQAVKQDQPRKIQHPSKNISFCLDSIDPSQVPPLNVTTPPVIAPPSIAVPAPSQQQLTITSTSFQEHSLQKDNVNFSFLNNNVAVPLTLPAQSTLTVPSLEDGGVFAMVKVGCHIVCLDWVDFGGNNINTTWHKFCIVCAFLKYLQQPTLHVVYTKNTY